jgi:hypothetical protein
VSAYTPASMPWAIDSCRGSPACRTLPMSAWAIDSCSGSPACCTLPMSAWAIDSCSGSPACRTLPMSAWAIDSCRGFSRLSSTFACSASHEKRLDLVGQTGRIQPSPGLLWYLKCTVPKILERAWKQCAKQPSAVCQVMSLRTAIRTLARQDNSPD